MTKKSKAAYEVDTMRKAIEDTGIVCQLRTNSGEVWLDVFWIPPTEYDPRLRPFLRTMPLALIQNLRINGFEEKSRYNLLTSGIFSASYTSKRQGALEIARGLIEDHTLVCASEDAVKWADR